MRVDVIAARVRCVAHGLYTTMHDLTASSPGKGARSVLDTPR